MEEIASDPYAIAAVWRFHRSTLSRSGVERITAERLLVEMARKVEAGLNAGDQVKEAAFSAVYDVTGEAKS